MVKRLVIYHADCSDGFCAAWLFHKVYPDATFVACPNLRPFLPNVVGPETEWDEIYILDYSFPREQMIELSKLTKLLVLAHHKTAAQDCEGLEFCTFDLSKSGAMLAYDYLTNKYPDRTYLKDMHKIVKYVQDRDLWTWLLPDSKEINSAIRSYQMTFESWDELSYQTLRGLFLEGKAIERYRNKLIDVHVQRASSIELVGHTVLGVSCTVKDIVSEVAGKLAEGQPFGFTFCENDKEWMTEYSLRSRPEGLDVSKLAKTMGGGGHARAAGFNVKW